MIDEKFQIPILYRKMNENGFLNYKSKSYLWLNEMEWMSIEQITTYEYEEGESRLIIPFAHNGHGDKWVWVISENAIDSPVGFCPSGEWEGTYYALNLHNAIFRQIIEFVASSNFYISKDKAKSYQMSEKELKVYLSDWREKLDGLLDEKFLIILDKLLKKSLKLCKSNLGEWYALLSPDEEAEIINHYLQFPLINCEFEWFIE